MTLSQISSTSLTRRAVASTTSFINHLCDIYLFQNQSIIVCESPVGIEWVRNEDFVGFLWGWHHRCYVAIASYI